MRSLLIILLALLLLPVGAFAKYEQSRWEKTNSIGGYWLTQNKRSVIKIDECEDNFCGRIYWIIEGGMKFDEKNPEESKRSTPMCGLKILWGFEENGENEWEDGKIYKADDGDIYDADMEYDADDDTLDVRGYIGISLFGKSQTWTRVSPDDYPKCGPAK